MAILTSKDLLAEIRRFQLLDDSRLAEIVCRILPDCAEPRLLAAQLLRRGWLTPYQLNHLFSGAGAELVLGSYLLLERLGTGGMGQVFKARHQRLGRTVALKVLRKERVQDPEAIHRFQREILAVGQLSHPNIVLAYDADEINGRYFFVMEYVEGIDLARRVQQNGPLPLALACEAIRQAALGLQHAFERGLVHRDVKPSNLILTADGTTVKLLDLGLARFALRPADDASATLTGVAVLMGTPDYLAPEQAADPHHSDVRSDLYSLGCTFYHLLAGEPPFAGGTPLEKVFHHRLDEPRPLRNLRPEVPPAVDAIVARLLRKRPEDRYAFPAQLAADLDTCGIQRLEVEPGAQVRPRTGQSSALMQATASRAPTVLADLRKRSAALPLIGSAHPTPVRSWKKRPTLLLAASTRRPAAKRRAWPRQLTISVLALGSSLTLFFLLLARDARPTAERDPAATSLPVESVDELALRHLLKEFQTAPADVQRLRRELAAFRVQYPGTRSARQAAEFLQHLPSPLDRLDGRGIPADECFELPQGVELVWSIRDLATPNKSTGQERAGPITALALSPDDQKLATGHKGGKVRLWDAAAGKVGSVLGSHRHDVTALAFTPDGTTLVSGAVDHLGIGWDTTLRKEKFRLAGHREPVVAVACSPEGSLVATVSRDGNGRLWDSSTGKERTVLGGHHKGLTAVTFSLDGSLVATGGLDQRLYLWSAGGREKMALDRFVGRGVAFLPDNRALVVGGPNGTVSLWDLTDPKRPTNRTLPRLSIQDLRCLCLSPDGTILVAGGENRLVFWSLAQEKIVREVRLPGTVTSVAFASDGRHLACLFGPGSVGMLRLAPPPESAHWLASPP